MSTPTLRAASPASTRTPPVQGLPDRTNLYALIKSKDAEARGAFVVGVRSTGIFCAPGCPARTPNVENCEFFQSPAGALQAGYRACKRCKPLDHYLSAPEPAWARRIIEHLCQTPEAPLGAPELRAMGTDADKASRYFKSRMGVSVQALSRAARVGLAVRWLREGDSAAGAMRRAGYSSESGLRKAVHDLLGVSLTDAASRARTPFLSATWADTPLGPMLIVASAQGVCVMEFVDRRGLATSLSTLRQRLKMPILPIAGARHQHLAAAERWLLAYFAPSRRAHPPALALHTPGTPMQEAVWAYLCQIPLGETRTYAQVAKAIGKPKGVRAVAGAVGDNRVALAVPCHRVIGAGGDLTGYAGGVERKAWLLRHEGHPQCASPANSRTLFCE